MNDTKAETRLILVRSTSKFALNIDEVVGHAARGLRVLAHANVAGLRHFVVTAEKPN